MYNDEERTSISIKNLIIQVLFVLLFIFLLMWLFPTKSQMNEAVQPFYNRIFNENMMIIKNAAKDYFTLERLPQNVGDKVKLTLGDMLEKKLLLSFLDGNNNRCDENRSYVEVTKMDTEYVMKIYLSCSDNQDYILVHMGCYDYCKTTICEKDNEDVVTNPTRPTITIPVVPTPTPTKNYKCEYLKVTNGYYTDWSSWSDWSTEIAYKSDLKDVESKVETTTQEVQKIVDYKVTVYPDKNKPTKWYTETKIIGVKTITYCVEEGIEYVHTGEYKYTLWSDPVTKRFNTAMSDTDTTSYTLKSTGHDDGCGECNNGLYYLYDVRTREKIEIVKENVVCKKTATKQEDIIETIKTPIAWELVTKIEPIYGIVIEKTDTNYYRFRTRQLIKGTEDRKWSNCSDSSLLNSGYNIIQKVEY